MLMEEFASKSVTMRELYDQHNPGKRYIKSNYKYVLKKLESTGKIKVEPPAEKRKSGTFGDNVIVTFPLKNKG